MLLVSEPVLGAEEKAALLAVIDDGWITMGERVRSLERKFAEQHKAPDAVAVSSCTAGLHLILHALGIGPGDEVLVPSLTFVATVNCVLYTGAKPVFVDIEAIDTPLMSLDDAASKCTPRTRAVILMHYAGYVGRATEWQAFAKEKNLYLVEDAAHAAGAEQAGSIGDAAAFSFYGNKNMTTAEGGIVLAREPQLLDRMRQLRSHGMTSSTFQRYAKRSVGYDVTMLGFNYRMDDLRAAIGLVQLERLEAWNERRRVLTQTYMQALAREAPSIELPFSDWRRRTNTRSSHHIMPIVLPAGTDRDRVIAALRDAGVQTSVHYPSVHRLSYFRRQFPNIDLPVSESYAERELTLPLHPKLEVRDAEFVAASVAGALGH